MNTSRGDSLALVLPDVDRLPLQQRMGLDPLRHIGVGGQQFRFDLPMVEYPVEECDLAGGQGEDCFQSLATFCNHALDPVAGLLFAGESVANDRNQLVLDFARIIRAMLRQAPNIILVGEMRDSETAEMGIQASLTGHLVFSTLHTNDAPGAVTGLIDMGVPPYLVASSVIAIAAQRLVRVICNKCKQPHSPSEAALEAAGIPPDLAAKGKFMRGKGCGNCQKTGYRGRLGIYELMLLTSGIRELIFSNASTQDIRKAAVSEGMKVLYEDGIDKVLKGITTLEEVYRVAKRFEGGQ